MGNIRDQGDRQPAELSTAARALLDGKYRRDNYPPARLPIRYSRPKTPRSISQSTASPKLAKLPPTNGPRHEETYCLRAYLTNMHTDQHKDPSDWKGGLTGIAQLGDFTGMLIILRSFLCFFNSELGKGMVFKELEIILPGISPGPRCNSEEASSSITSASGQVHLATPSTTRLTKPCVRLLRC